MVQEESPSQPTKMDVDEPTLTQVSMESEESVIRLDHKYVFK